MIDHMSSYAVDFAKSRSFYGAVMASLGHPLQVEMEMSWDKELPNRKASAWGPDRGIFWLIETKVSYEPRHFAFSAESRGRVDAFYESALAAGGRDHGAPGLRAVYHANYYGGFVLDPDGNNVEAVCHRPEWP